MADIVEQRSQANEPLLLVRQGRPPVLLLERLFPLFELLPLRIKSYRRDHLLGDADGAEDMFTAFMSGAPKYEMCLA